MEQTLSLYIGLVQQGAGLHTSCWTSLTLSFCRQNCQTVTEIDLDSNAGHTWLLIRLNLRIIVEHNFVFIRPISDESNIVILTSIWTRLVQCYITFDRSSPVQCKWSDHWVGLYYKSVLVQLSGQTNKKFVGKIPGLFSTLNTKCSMGSTLSGCSLKKPYLSSDSVNPRHASTRV